MKRLMIAAALAFAPGPPCLAQVSDEALRDCARIDDSVARLACFDELAGDRAPAPPVAAVTEGVGLWQVTTEVSPIDDSTNVVALLEASEKIAGRFGGQSAVTLIVQCKENRTAVAIHFGGQFMSDHEYWGKVTYRIDKQPAEEVRMSASTSNEALFWPDGEDIGLLRRLSDARTLLIQATPYNENSVTVEFHVAGVVRALTPLREACGWSLEGSTGVPAGGAGAATVW